MHTIAFYVSYLAVSAALTVWLVGILQRSRKVFPAIRPRRSPQRGKYQARAAHPLSPFSSHPSAKRQAPSASLPTLQPLHRLAGDLLEVIYGDTRAQKKSA